LLFCPSSALLQVTKIRTRQQQFSVDGVGYDPYSGDIQGPEGSVRKTAPDLLTKLYWLTLPGVIANDGGLVAPNALVARWPSQRAGAGGAATPAGTVAAPPAAIGGATATSSVAETDHSIVPVGAGDGVTKVGSETAEGAGGIPAGWEISGDPTDVAVLVLGHKAGIDGNINSFKSSFPTVAKVPFDSDYKVRSRFCACVCACVDLRLLFDCAGGRDERLPQRPPFTFRTQTPVTCAGLLFPPSRPPVRPPFPPSSSWRSCRTSTLPRAASASST
jgi:hypothetical protein